MAGDSDLCSYTEEKNKKCFPLQKLNIGFCSGIQKELESHFSQLLRVDYVHSCLRCINNMFHQLNFITCCSTGR